MDGTAVTVEAGSSGREYYAIRGIDVLAIVAFWALLAVVSGVSRELDPRIPGLPSRVVQRIAEGRGGRIDLAMARVAAAYSAGAMA